MTFKETMANLFSASEGAYYKWKRENRPIIQLVDKYLSKENIEEFLETGKIQKFETISYITNNYIQKNLKIYIDSFKKSQSLLSEPHVNDNFIDFYFYFLTNFENLNLSSNANFSGIHSVLAQFLYLYQIKELEIGKINEEMEELEIKLAIPNINKDEIKKHTKEKLFLENKGKFRGIIKFYSTFNTWSDDMYYFLQLVIKEEFGYFISSGNDELLYQAIGYLVYSKYQNMDKSDKLDLIYSSYHYFIANKDLISKENIKKHILDRNCNF
ncbi:hypothetical protein [Aliarcobacter butzleri]|uniref:hypothetical protein n=1 Tax=Aliarcobacter butzleri TaxID=28197 RepID=UPI001EDBB149|nr:hypothetical protein [Aliarcobacter butzleri]MCG3654660.1 hypothetical protein [Aliarcobacter butzleri]